MWITKFKLKDKEDIYSPLCVKYKIEFFAYPYTSFIKNNKINLLGGGILSGSEENKLKFLSELKKDKRIKKIEQEEDFILVHVQHPLSRENRAEINIFYNPQYIVTKPVYMASDGWEYWEVACLDRQELNKLINPVLKHYFGKIFFVREEKLKQVSSLGLFPKLSPKQKEAIELAFKQGYYNYPRRLTLPKLAKQLDKSYSAFQENLRKAEKKILEYFFRYS